MSGIEEMIKQATLGLDENDKIQVIMDHPDLRKHHGTCTLGLLKDVYENCINNLLDIIESNMDINIEDIVWEILTVKSPRGGTLGNKLIDIVNKKKYHSHSK